MEDRCVCCGRVIPEGTMVCKICIKKADIGYPSSRRDSKNRKSIRYWLKSHIFRNKNG